MSTNSKSFTLNRAQQPRSRITKIIPLESETKSSPGRTAARRPSRTQPTSELPAQRSSVSQSQLSSEDRQFTQRKSSRKQRPKDLRRFRAFQAGASRPKFKKARIDVANPSQQITKKKIRAKTSVITPQFKKAKI